LSKIFRSYRAGHFTTKSKGMNMRHNFVLTDWPTEKPVFLLLGGAGAARLTSIPEIAREKYPVLLGRGSLWSGK
jgi:hypothetical protein